jgi:hypothetical protein
MNKQLTFQLERIPILAFESALKNVQQAYRSTFESQMSKKSSTQFVVQLLTSNLVILGYVVGGKEVFDEIKSLFP